MSDKFVALIVCTGNTCRSPMAEGALRMLLEKERPGKFEVMSAGTAAAADYPATLYAIEASKIWDIDISGHLSQPLMPSLIDEADLIFGMTADHVAKVLKMQPDAADKTFLLKRFPEPGSNGEGVDDPIGMALDRYNETFLEIGEYLGKHLGEIVKKIDEKTNNT
ncbi:MAG: low molecular weight protein arginine phosphatase [candidate division Zixibacteria bacterium]|nr:low molecular weight protein arginine phosphatase [candidate division Zixibacteria bacterium]